MDLIDTYQIATCGQNLINTFTLASNGILIDIFVEDEPVVVPPDVANSGDAGVIGDWIKTEKKKHKKRITVKVGILGKEYIETKLVEGHPNLKAENIKVSVTKQNTNKPDIKITLDL